MSRSFLSKILPRYSFDPRLSFSELQPFGLLLSEGGMPSKSSAAGCPGLKDLSDNLMKFLIYQGLICLFWSTSEKKGKVTWEN
jgi:hypothetical protein